MDSVDNRVGEQIESSIRTDNTNEEILCLSQVEPGKIITDQTSEFCVERSEVASYYGVTANRISKGFGDNDTVMGFRGGVADFNKYVRSAYSYIKGNFPTVPIYVCAATITHRLYTGGSGGPKLNFSFSFMYDGYDTYTALNGTNHTVCVGSPYMRYGEDNSSYMLYVCDKYVNSNNFMNCEVSYAKGEIYNSGSKSRIWVTVSGSFIDTNGNEPAKETAMVFGIKVNLVNGTNGHTGSLRFNTIVIFIPNY